MIRAPKLPTILTGIAGEYFVAAELWRRGYVASLTLRNTRGTDLLVSNRDATKSVGIQVKTNQGAKPNWILSKKAGIDVATNLFYVFVALRGMDPPQFYVVPREEVSKFVRDNHKKWLATPGRGGRAHRDTDVRQFIANPGYLERWDLLGLD